MENDKNFSKEHERGLEQQEDVLCFWKSCKDVNVPHLINLRQFHPKHPWDLEGTNK